MRDKGQQLKKRLAIMAALAVVFAILSVVCGMVGFSQSTPPDATTPETDKPGNVQTVPETALETEPEIVPETTAETEPEIVPETTAETEPEVIPEVAADNADVESSDDTLPEADASMLEDTPLQVTEPQSAAVQAEKNASELAIGKPGAASEEAPEHRNILQIVFRITACFFLIALIADVFMMVLIINNIRQYKKRVSTKVNSYEATEETPMQLRPKAEEPPAYPIPGISLGKVHKIGRRDYQQDSFGHIPVLDNRGILAVLADGMGGLSNGEKVSQNLVMECLNYGAYMTESNQTLESMLAIVNQKINRQLGPDGLRKSGSTIVSVLIAENRLHWVSVGDSRIYLYRDRYLSQITRDHDLFQQWMPKILEGSQPLQESLQNMDGRKLTSFIGMGDIRFTDRSITPVKLLPGDRILLMSDGIYGVVPDEKMEAILRSCGNVQEAASQIAQCVIQVDSPYQDNYTLMILGYDPEM